VVDRYYSQFLAENKDFDDFLNHVSDATGEMLQKDWIKNMKENRFLFSKDKWATEQLHDKEKGRTAIIIGSSPALAKQLDTLREIQDDKEFVLCGLSSNLEYLTKNNVRPKYVIVIDSDESTGHDWDNVDMEKTKDITLITSLYTYPPMLRKWKGPLYWLAFAQMDKKVKKVMDRYFSPINATGDGFPPIMSQYNEMTIFSFATLGTHIILFIGNEMSFKEVDSQFYVHRRDDREKVIRRPHMDIHGNMVSTNLGLLALKISLEAFLETICGAGWFINCTEAGIFGITKRFKDYHVPWIQQLTLKHGIAQARHIMRTGNPYWEPGLVKEVRHERFQRTLPFVQHGGL